MKPPLIVSGLQMIVQLTFLKAESYLQRLKSHSELQSNVGSPVNISWVDCHLLMIETFISTHPSGWVDCHQVHILMCPILWLMNKYLWNTWCCTGCVITLCWTVQANYQVLACNYGNNVEHGKHTVFDKHQRVRIVIVSVLAFSL